MAFTENELEDVGRWLRRLCESGFKLPESYIVFDVETTGLNVNQDYIAQIGHLIVENRVPREPIQTILDWTRCENVSQGDLRQRFYETEAEITKLGMPYKFKYERLAQDGVDPIKVLEIYLDIFKEHQDNNCVFVTHNGWNFDSRIVCSHFARFLNSPFKLYVDLLVDVGLLEKARQLGMTRIKDEPLDTFYCRVYKAFGKGTLWSLHRHCIPNYDLANKYKLNMADAHTAGFDCYATHLLLEEYRKLM